MNKFICGNCANFIITESEDSLTSCRYCGFELELILKKDRSIFNIAAVYENPKLEIVKNMINSNLRIVPNYSSEVVNKFIYNRKITKDKYLKLKQNRRFLKRVERRRINA